MTFSSASAVTAYLSGGKGGPAGALTACLANPTTRNSSGDFGTQVTAFKLNVDFNTAGLMPRGVTTAYSSLIVCATGFTSIDGHTVAQVLGLAETALGGGGLPPGMAYSDVSAIAADLNLSFDDNGTQFCPSTWANAHLFFNSCP
ncbi:MAG TPA: hypothetical protein VEF03_03920, partial [Candidatus Binataceae bacterium]|nr:hypothetical protein [Candidatus Binataceae bacterium]